MITKVEHNSEWYYIRSKGKDFFNEGSGGPSSYPLTLIARAYHTK